MKFWVIATAGMVLAGAAIAQTPAPAAKNVIGEVTAADPSAKQLTIKADNGPNYTLKLDAKTSFLRIPPGEKDLKKATPIAMGDVGVGDRVLARGVVSEEEKTVAARTVVVMSKNDLAKLHEQERQAWQNGVVGTVTAINPANKEISISTRGANAHTVIVDASNNASFLRYAPGSYQFSDAKPGSFDDIQPGDTLRVRGQKNDDGTRIKADQVLSGSFLTFAAKVDAVDAPGGVIKLTDIQTKKPMEVRVSNGTVLRRIPEQMATMMARRLNPAAAGGEGANTPADRGGEPGARGGPGGPERGVSSDGGPGRGNFGGRGNLDVQQMLERAPALQLAELKPGDALIISSTKGSDPSKVTAITIVAGVEPFLAAAPRSSGEVNLGDWNLDGGIPGAE